MALKVGENGTGGCTSAQPILTVRDTLERLAQGHSLTRVQAAGLMGLIARGEVGSVQFGALMMGLRGKGETVEEMVGFASVIREEALEVQVQGPILDTCGTGGDRSGTFNISTTAAFVAAAAGATVGKHGNRAVSGSCGSADLLEALGIVVDLGPKGVRYTLEKTGMGFMLTSAFHPTARPASGLRRELEMRTLFNVLGPLTNPAHAQYQLVGVSEAELGPKMIEALRELGSTRSLVVHGDDGLDELTLSGPSWVYELHRGRITSYRLTPEQIGLSRTPTSELVGGGPQTNAEITRSVLRGEKGPRRDVVVLNAAAALLAAGIVGDLAEGTRSAVRALDSGKAMEKMRTLVNSSREARDFDVVSEGMAAP